MVKCIRNCSSRNTFSFEFGVLITTLKYSQYTRIYRLTFLFLRMVAIALHTREAYGPVGAEVAYRQSWSELDSCNEHVMGWCGNNEAIIYNFQ